MGSNAIGVLGDRDSILQEVIPVVKESFALEALSKMGDASLFNLVTAIVAARTPGIAGELVVSIPRKITDRLELHWRSAAPAA